MIDLKQLLEEIHADTSDPELLAIIWVLEHLTEELNCHFGEGLNIKTDCAMQFETHWRNLSESVGDYITNIIGESPRSHSMADMILALYQLYDFAAQAIEN